MKKNKNMSRTFFVRWLVGRLAEAAGLDLDGLIKYVNKNGIVSDDRTFLTIDNVVSAKKASGLYAPNTLATAITNPDRMGLKVDLLEPSY